MTSLRFEDLYVSSKQVWDLRKQAAAAEIEAAERMPDSSPPLETDKKGM